MSVPPAWAEIVKAKLLSHDIEPISVDLRSYPGEKIIVVRVPNALLPEATEIGKSLDRELAADGFQGFVTIRGSDVPAAPNGESKAGITDPRVSDLMTLLTARSRTSELQPSLSYVLDKPENLQRAVSFRNHLIFGRRGAGKTTLLVEAKRQIQEQRHLSVWMNLQTYRHSPAPEAFLAVCRQFCEQIQIFYSESTRTPHVAADAANLAEEISRIDSVEFPSEPKIRTLIPRVQAMLRRFGATSDLAIFVFLDDLHYLQTAAQPIFLDMVHGTARDCNVWLKVAGIRHLSNWFQPHPPIGLQTGHDADHIDLDLTLESPLSAKIFLEKVLRSYAEHARIKSVLNIFSHEALDRLVLASGAVPRDYLILSAAAIRQAQRRENARGVGVQDVNTAAGDAAKVKLAELQDDAASAGKLTANIVEGLNQIRSFCIDEKNSTYFRVDFRDKDRSPDQYNILQELLDLRLIHLVDGSLSDEKQAGRRSEVYMLDLSQFSGHRLKRKLKVLDFEAGRLVLKSTGTNTPNKIGSTPNQRLGILRRGPLLDLAQLVPGPLANGPGN